jgi:hypothetical protein
VNIWTLFCFSFNGSLLFNLNSCRIGGFEVGLSYVRLYLRHVMYVTWFYNMLLKIKLKYMASGPAPFPDEKLPVYAWTNDVIKIIERPRSCAIYLLYRHWSLLLVIVKRNADSSNQETLVDILSGQSWGAGWMVLILGGGGVHVAVLLVLNYRAVFIVRLCYLMTPLQLHELYSVDWGGTVIVDGD